MRLDEELIKDGITVKLIAELIEKCRKGILCI